MLPCVSLYFYQPCNTCEKESCRIKILFAEARDAVLSVLEKKTLQDLEQPAAIVSLAGQPPRH